MMQQATLTLHRQREMLVRMVSIRLTSMAPELTQRRAPAPANGRSATCTTYPAARRRTPRSHSARLPNRRAHTEQPCPLSGVGNGFLALPLVSAALPILARPQRLQFGPHDSAAER